MELRCSLLELGPASCRWPFGDPGAEDFVYCGADVMPNAPYCACHAALAYRVPAPLTDAQRWRLRRQAQRLSRRKFLLDRAASESEEHEEAR